MQLKIAKILEQKQNYDEALRAYRRVTYTDRNSIDANLGMMRVSYAQQDYLGAIVEAKDVLDINKNNPQAHYYLGLAYKERGRKREAKPALKQARQLYQQENDQEMVQQIDQLLEEL